MLKRRQDGLPKPPVFFIAGCLLILLITSVQIWHGSDELSSSPPDFMNLPVVNFAAPAGQYSADPG